MCPLPPAAVIGCDVGKTQIATYNTRTGRKQAVANRREAIEAFLAELEDGCLIVCESTGGYETALLEAALLTGRDAHRADARKVKAFIRSFGTLAKTDTLDARALARYGQERHAQLPRWQIPDRARTRLQALVMTRRDLVGDRQAYCNRIGAPTAAPVAHHLQPVIDVLSQQIAAVEAAIAALINAEPDMARDVAALQTIGGIGQTIAPALLALMPEIGTLTGRQAAALAGVAPHPNQSGDREGYRLTRGGRPILRHTLFMAALSASQHNPTLARAYKALQARGKKPIVAVVALMRRLIVIANAVLRDARQARKNI